MLKDLTMRGTVYPCDTESAECCATGVVPIPLPRLTTEMRAWLNAPERRQMLTWRFAVDFAQQFNLTGERAGRLLAAWVKELA